MTTEPLWSDERIIDLLERANERYGNADGVDASAAEDLMIEMRDSYEAELAQRQQQSNLLRACEEALKTFNWLYPQASQETPARIIEARERLKEAIVAAKGDKP